MTLQKCQNFPSANPFSPTRKREPSKPMQTGTRIPQANMEEDTCALDSARPRLTQNAFVSLSRLSLIGD